MTNFFKGTISAIFGISALTKIFDFENTVVYFASFTNINIEVVHYLVATTILIELTFVCLLVFNQRSANTVYSVILITLIAFLGTSVAMAFMEAENCGCFGTFLEVNPLISVLKNLLLIVMTYLLKYDSRGMKHV